MPVEYDHTQYGRLHHLIGLAAGGCLVGALLSGMDSPEFIPLVGAAAVFIVLGGCFVHLRVRDDGDALEVRFGPISLFGTRIPYERIESVETARTCLLDAWGIHGCPGRNVTWSVSGFDAVALRLARPHGLFRFRAIKIGTDEPEKLAAFIRTRIPANALADAPGAQQDEQR